MKLLRGYASGEVVQQQHMYSDLLIITEWVVDQKVFTGFSILSSGERSSKEPAIMHGKKDGWVPSRSWNIPWE